MASEGGVFAFASLPLVNERLPLLSHFGPKRFETGNQLLTVLPEGSAPQIPGIFLNAASPCLPKSVLGRRIALKDRQTPTAWPRRFESLPCC